MHMNLIWVAKRFYDFFFWPVYTEASDSIFSLLKIINKSINDIILFIVHVHDCILPLWSLQIDIFYSFLKSEIHKFKIYKFKIFKKFEVIIWVLYVWDDRILYGWSNPNPTRLESFMMDSFDHPQSQDIQRKIPYILYWYNFQE